MLRLSKHLPLQILMVFLCQLTVYGQTDTAQKTVHEKVTTIRETTTTVSEVKKTEDKSRVVAIFIKNRSGNAFKDKLAAFEDLVIGEITDLGFQVVSSEDTINAVAQFSGEKNRPVSGSELDELLENNTSALRLAQNMAVDYLFVASITTFGKDTQHIKRPDMGIDRKKTTAKLRGTYKILDIAMGKSLTAGNVMAAKTTQASNTMSESTDAINDLLADAAKQFASKLLQKRTTQTLAKSNAGELGLVTFTIDCAVQDMSVPEVTKDEKGEYILTGNRYKLEPMAVAVEVDGITIGTTQSPLQAYPGLHKIKLTRKGFEDWSKTINIRDKQHYSIPMQLSAEGRKRWMEMAGFLAKLKQNERLSEANAEAIKSYGQMLRQSGLRVDTKDAPTINQKNIDVVPVNIWGGH